MFNPFNPFVARTAFAICYTPDFLYIRIIPIDRCVCLSQALPETGAQQPWAKHAGLMLLCSTVLNDAHYIHVRLDGARVNSMHALCRLNHLFSARPQGIIADRYDSCQDTLGDRRACEDHCRQALLQGKHVIIDR